MIYLAGRALRHRPGGSIVWVGRECWPYPVAIAQGPGGPALLRASLFVNPPGQAERIWAIDAALRCPGVAAVIADARGLTMPQSRRLQLASDAGVPALLTRPDRERCELSVARTRWRVTPHDAADPGPCWAIELLRCKGPRPLGPEARLLARLDHETGDVRLVPHPEPGPSQATGAAAG